ncbi:hypothetical protein Ndes2437B_g07924 [Nannochloris sp. 'desiccata']
MHGVLAPSSMQTLASTPLLIKSTHISNRRPPQQRALIVAKSNPPILKNAVIGIASAAALAGAALFLVRNNPSASPSRRRDEDYNRSNSKTSTSTSTFNALHHHHYEQHQLQLLDNRITTPRWMQLGWRRSTETELAFIEAKRAREAAYELESWDRRWKLRKKTLPELRQMAAKMKISGRTKMRKPELVAVLEERLGLGVDRNRL